MKFVTQCKVRFAHVDAAGIVFYPRYLEMLNGAIEDWFAQALGCDFAAMHLREHMGVPTVKLDVEFFSPSRLGDELDLTVIPQHIGRSSCKVQVVFSGDGEERLRATVVLVCIDLDTHRSVAWPKRIRQGIEMSIVPAFGQLSA